MCPAATLPTTPPQPPPIIIIFTPSQECMIHQTQVSSYRSWNHQNSPTFILRDWMGCSTYPALPYPLSREHSTCTSTYIHTYIHTYIPINPNRLAWGAGIKDIEFGLYGWRWGSRYSTVSSIVMMMMLAVLR